MNTEEYVNLTDREVEIIKLFALQFNGREIAEKLSVSTRTVEKHKELLMQKTGSNNFIGVIIYAIQRHYISDQDLKRGALLKKYSNGELLINLTVILLNFKSL